MLLRFITSIPGITSSLHFIKVAFLCVNLPQFVYWVSCWRQFFPLLFGLFVFNLEHSVHLYLMKFPLCLHFNLPPYLVVFIGLTCFFYSPFLHLFVYIEFFFFFFLSNFNFSFSQFGNIYSISIHLVVIWEITVCVLNLSEFEVNGYLSFPSDSIRTLTFLPAPCYYCSIF